MAARAEGRAVGAALRGEGRLAMRLPLPGMQCSKRCVISTVSGTAAGFVDSWVQAASVTCESMIVSYSIAVNLPRPRWHRFRWQVRAI